MVVDLVWVVVDGGGFFGAVVGDGGSILGDGGWQWVVAWFSLNHLEFTVTFSLCTSEVLRA